MKNTPIIISAPGKIHLLGEHAVVYGKPALLASVDLRVTVTIFPVIARPAKAGRGNLPNSEDSSLIVQNNNFKKVIEPLVKKYLNIKNIPPYQLTVSSRIPIGAGLGSSAAISAAYIAVLLSFLKVKWDLRLINDLTFEAEKIFHGNPSGADNTTVVYGGLIYYIKGKPFQSLPFSIPPKLAKNFILINTGKPKETTKEMVEMVSSKFKVQSSKFRQIFDNQEQLVKEFLLAIRGGNENQLIQIIKAGEKNLEALGVVSDYVTSIIRIIEVNGGAAKISGAGGKTGPTGILLCYHPKPSVIKNIAKSHQLDYIKTTLGVEGLRIEKHH